jgi:hypothetical protein
VPKFGPEWHALKGLIQISAVALKRIQNHPRAAETLQVSALRHLEAAAAHPRTRGAPCLGIDLVDLALAAESAWSAGRTPSLRLVD